MRRIIVHAASCALTEGQMVGSVKAGAANSAKHWPIVISLTALACLGAYAWQIIADKNQKALETLGLAKFTPLQMEVWDRCNELYDRLERVHRKLEEFDGPGTLANRSLARDLYIPNACKALEKQRRSSVRGNGSSIDLVLCSYRCTIRRS